MGRCQAAPSHNQGLSFGQPPAPATNSGEWMLTIRSGHIRGPCNVTPLARTEKIKMEIKCTAKQNGNERGGGGGGGGRWGGIK